MEPTGASVGQVGEQIMVVAPVQPRNRVSYRRKDAVEASVNFLLQKTLSICLPNL